MIREPHKRIAQQQVRSARKCVMLKDVKFDDERCLVTMKLTVTQKLSLLVGFALFGIALQMGPDQQRLNKVYDAVNYSKVNTVPSLLVLVRLQKNFLLPRLRMNGPVLNADDAALAQVEIRLKTAQDEEREAIKKYEPLVSDDIDRDFLNQEKKLFEEYATDLGYALVELRARHNDAADKLMMRAQDVSEKIVDLINQQFDYKIEQDKKAWDEAVAAKSHALNLSLIVATLTLVALGMIAFTVTRAFLKPLTGEPEVAADIANAMVLAI